MGLEPTRTFMHKILSLACLPIPALPHIQFAVGDYLANRGEYSTDFRRMQPLFLKFSNPRFQAYFRSSNPPFCSIIFSRDIPRDITHPGYPGQKDSEAEQTI